MATQFQFLDKHTLETISKTKYVHVIQLVEYNANITQNFSLIDNIKASLFNNLFHITFYIAKTFSNNLVS